MSDRPGSCHLSTQHRVTRKIKDPLAALKFEEKKEEELVETGGITFSNGHCIELIKNGRGSPILLDSRSKKCYERINHAGLVYVPPLLAPSVLEALTLPSKPTDCGSTVEMFEQIRNFFLGQGVSDDAAKACTYFAFATWFPESLPVAPCLVLAGTQAEARVLLRLLTSVVRHALLLAEFNLAIFHRFPMHVQPTLLIGCVHPSMWKLFSASDHPGTFVVNKNGLTDLYCAKAAYAGPASWAVCGDGILNISCVLHGGRLPVINGLTLEKIAADFQPKLLDYRLKHVAHVQDSDFDAQTLPIPLRILARALGSCIVDAPELQADIVRLLESQGEELRANRLLDPKCVAIEAMFAHCHGENGSTRVGVNEIAAMATAIMADRGEITVFEPRRMGSLLRLLGFRPMRNAKGFAIHLTADVHRLVHRLARDLKVGDSVQAVRVCPHCSESVCAQTGGSKP
jgi:hypothetical protein